MDGKRHAGKKEVKFMPKEAAHHPPHKGSAHGKHHMLMMLPCLVIAIVVIAGGFIFGWSASQWSIVAMLAVCGLGHLLMMKGHNH